MILQRLRLRFPLFPFVSCSAASFRSTSKRKTPGEDEEERDFCELGESNEEQGQPTFADEASFPLNSLPTELLVQVIEQIVVLCITGLQSDNTPPELHLPELHLGQDPGLPFKLLAYPRKPCWNLHAILSLRLVNSTWAKEVLLSLHNNLTLPNLPESLPSRFLPSTSPSIPHRRALFASALYNSTLSVSNRRIGNTLPKQIVSYANYALSLYPPPLLAKKEILKRLCTAASQKTTYARTLRLGAESRFLKNQIHCFPRCLNLPQRDFEGFPSRSRDTDLGREGPVNERNASNICTLVILGMEDRAIKLLDAAPIVCVSYVFGRLDCVARDWGRKKVLKWFERAGAADKLSWGGEFMDEMEWLDRRAKSYR